MLEEVLSQRKENHTLSAEEIALILPHRYPFALVDRIDDYEPGVWAVGRKCVSMDEPFFQGHFPGKPIMPGVLIIEALAQTGAIAALSLPENKGKIALFGGIKNARFKKQVVPGDVLELRCQMIRQKGPVGIAEAQALVDGKTVAKTEITFSIV
ncbi:MAG: 3-hydroxyacyl-ACP dehydratase FabZ [Lachnospiraceae bacterium]|nr:3-hydroxyacyl-ACP dehydratase FabZ [Lachnospiraceae bacterium]